ncbi:MAG: SLBB domain-containing protein, partial [Lentisphaeria bacterium]|nr:SLBB domain-containing protein [Lentisphaeria bacterium]
MSNISEISKELGRRVIICAGTGCVANGSLEVYQAFQREMTAAGLTLLDTPDHRTPLQGDQNGLHLTKSGCQGFCQMGPLVTILPQNVLYCKVKAEDVAEIVRETLVRGVVLDKFLYLDKTTGKHCQGTEDIAFYTRQKRTVLANCGLIDPESIQEYLREDGYGAARKAYTGMTPEQVCQTMLDSGLRGRGGGGFPAGRKWELARVQPGDKKYVICNGDEGDPGAFMDRSLMEGNPHCIIEGLMIAARAIGANEGYFYVRTEYPLAVRRLRLAVDEATRAGILGDNVFGTGLGLHLHVMEGAGAFVCGEETALIASIEGKRGMPTPKPPFPAQSGLWGKPTIINNVETLATVPLILRDGVAAFRADGTELAPGTKTFALTGHVLNTGLIEVPMGTTLRHVVENVGGGVTDAKGNPGGVFKAVQIGGPSGGCLTADMLDTPLDYESLRKVGAMVGSGG